MESDKGKLKQEALVIERIFDAPLQRVWEAWTNPEIFQKWWGPKGFTLPVLKMDLSVGGKYFNCMKGPDDKEYWGTGTYLEIEPMKKIVCDDAFSDREGNVIPASDYGMDINYPLHMKIIYTFEDFGGGKTKFTLEHFGIPEGAERQAAFSGWNESFDKLDKVL